MSSPPASRSLALLVGLVLVLAAVAPAGTSAPAPSQYSPTPADTDSASQTANDTGPASPTLNDTDPVNNPVPPSIAQPGGTTSYLQIPDGEVATSGLRTVSVDVTTVTRIGTDTMELEMAFESFLARFENADTEAERTAAVREIEQILDRETAALRQRQQRALQRYNGDDVSTQTFLSTLARLDATAGTIQTIAGDVLDKDENTLDYTIPPGLQAQLRNYEGRVIPLRGTIRRVVLLNAVNGANTSSVYLETGADQIVLATVVGDRYARDGFNGGALEPDQPPKLRIFRDALNRTAILYPWAMADENRRSVPRVSTYWNSSVFSVEVLHEQGRLFTYLDASSTNVFSETQNRDVDLVPTRTVATNGTAALQLTVNTTHETGPLHVMTTRPGTDNPVNASVYVDDVYVGETRSGSRWTVDTRGPTTIRVESDAGTVLTARLEASA